MPAPTGPPPAFSGIDHVHVFVADRPAAARWYACVLGLEPVAALASWADDGGPLTIADAHGSVHLALFERAPQACRSTIALRTDAAGFLAWQRRLAVEFGDALRLSDHAASWSLYFHDPDGNPYEITCYEHAALVPLLADAWALPLQAGALRLEAVTPAHADAMFPLLADPALYRYIDQPPPASLEALRERYARLAKGAPPEARQRWLNWIVQSADGASMGTVQATVIDADRASWIAYVFGRAHHGRGHATAAVRALIEHLAARGVLRVLAMVEAENVASIGLLERLGFAPAGADDLDAHRPEPSERLYVRALRRAPTPAPVE